MVTGTADPLAGDARDRRTGDRRQAGRAGRRTTSSARVRRLAGTRQVGHAGTLDPMATGVLVLGVGKATRLLHHLVLADKAYTATIRLGQATVTDDAEGEVAVGRVRRGGHRGGRAGRRAAADRRHRAGAAARSRRSRSTDARAYKRVRDGEAVELAARPVTVTRFDATRVRPARAPTCSTSTSRSSARRAPTSGRWPATWAPRSGVGGHLTALRRTRVGPFALARARHAGRAGRAGRPGHAAAGRRGPGRAARARHRSPRTRRASCPSASRSTPRGRSPAPTARSRRTARAVALLRESDGRARPVLVFAAAG